MVDFWNIAIWRKIQLLEFDMFSRENSLGNFWNSDLTENSNF